MFPDNVLAMNQSIIFLFIYRIHNRLSTEGYRLEGIIVYFDKTLADFAYTQCYLNHSLNPFKLKTKLCVPFLEC